MKNVRIWPPMHPYEAVHAAAKVAMQTCHISSSIFLASQILQISIFFFLLLQASSLVAQASADCCSLLINTPTIASSSFSPAAPPVFNGEGLHIWQVKMRTYLQAFNLWEVVISDVEPAPLRANPTVAQIRQHADERTKRHKAMSCIQNCVSNVIFTRIMACETPKQAWDKLKKEFQGAERTRQQQLLKLRRDFENLKMKEEETGFGFSA
ncbi:putative LRR receptor-like serine/threonine-protein kinase [Gossypium australe]|uniref:Putative LRR receptor-like serine/threonine-protein kinase n=1 Tax=Gossypium australe TaxID=47621 RepID=A0A5B6VS62_9ROSI|nr:putative LRR receptor-like serine/threonine-protein kinase [Gossypium australe]